MNESILDEGIEVDAEEINEIEDASETDKDRDELARHME